MLVRNLIFSFLLVSFLSCNYTTPELLAPPKIVGSSNAATPSVAFFEMTASEPVRIILEIYDGADHRWLYQPGGLFKRQFEIPVFQLKPGIKYEFKLSLVDTWFNRVDFSTPFFYQVPNFPTDFPAIEVLETVEEEREPGFTLLSIARKKGNDLDENYGLLVALNRKGEVVWFFQHDQLLGSLQQCRTEHILAVDRKGYVLELNLKGDIIREFDSIKDLTSAKIDSLGKPINIPVLHGDVEPNSRRYYLALSEVTDSLAHRKKWRTQDRLLEFNRQGEILKDIAIQPLLDSVGFFNAQTLESDFSFQSITHDAKTGALIIASDYPPIIARVDRPSEKFSWVLNENRSKDSLSSGFSLMPDSLIQWPQRIKSIDFTSQSTFLILDESILPTNISSSRILEYVVDNKQKTIRQTWYYDGGEAHSFSADSNSMAYRLRETGNILFFAKNKKGKGFIREVTSAQVPKTVFEMKVSGDYEINGLLHLQDVQMKIEGE